jgi:hypothetical protein
VPPNRDPRVASFSTRSTPSPMKSSRSLSKPTGYGPHRFGLDLSYSTIGKRFVAGKLSASRTVFRSTLTSASRFSGGSLSIDRITMLPDSNDDKTLARVFKEHLCRSGRFRI